MNRQVKQEQGEDSNNIDLQDSEGMNEHEQALFLNIQRSKSNDSVLGKLLPQPGDAPQRPLIWEMNSHYTSNILITQNRSVSRDKPEQEGKNGNLPQLKGLFKRVKKQKVRSKCDYEKNICGYITKKVIREFVSKAYEKQVLQLVKKYNSDYKQCKGYYLRKVQMVTGPSHLPELFDANPAEGPSIAACKKVFKSFYRWFLKQRYLRYLLLQGKMSKKESYIEYKNTHLFKYVKEEEEEEVPHVQTRSRSTMKEELKLEHS